MGLLMLAMFIPAVTAGIVMDDQADEILSETGLRPKVKIAMVSGRFTEARQIGSLIIGKAERLSYIGMKYEGGFDFGVVRNKWVMFRETPQFKAMAIGNYVFVSGTVLKLRV